MSIKKEQPIEKKDDGFPYEWKTEKLNEFLGGFKLEYLNAINSTEEPITVKIQGKTYNMGRLKLMHQYGAVSLRRKPYPELLIHSPDIDDWNKKENAMHEIQTRKEYAQKMDLGLQEQKENLIEQKSMPVYGEEEIDPALIPF